MPLYKMELRKIWGRKITLISAMILLALTVSYLAILISGERVIIDGTSYKGILAIQKNREIEEKYKGNLDNRKLKNILRETNPWEDQNYMTDFIVQWLSDGTLERNDNVGIYKEPKHIYSIEETELGKYMEYQEKTAGIIYTSEYGRTKGPGAKIAAAFTTAAVSFAVITGIGIVICRQFYGAGNRRMITGILLGELNKNLTLYGMEIGKFAILYLLVACGGILMLTGIILWLSAQLKKNYHVVIVTVAIWLLPIMFRFILGPGNWMVLGETQPFYLIIYKTLVETDRTRALQIAMIAAGTFGGAIMGYKKSAEIEKV